MGNISKITGGGTRPHEHQDQEEEEDETLWNSSKIERGGTLTHDIKTKKKGMELFGTIATGLKEDEHNLMNTKTKKRRKIEIFGVAV
ncbi:unnamed protein product [Sphagnum jensenii]|uniref:Uncharacterized protein n=1 Tax=Sphagnum jensenii TaxID=128206 RepID=A0ABP0X3R2_9BRYO